MTEIKDAIIPYALIKSLSQIDNVYEMRLFGWVIAKAQSVLKMYNKDLADINLQYALNLVRVTLPAKYLLVPGDNNYRNIRKAFTLADKTIEYERDGNYYHLHIIAFPEYQNARYESKVTFVIHNEVWHAFLNNFKKGWRLFNLPTYMRLKSCYSVIMYMLISQQTKPMTYKLSTMKTLLGVDDKPAYERNANFIKRVIEAAKKELDENSPTSFIYDLNRAGRGGGYDTITLHTTDNPAYVPPANERQRTKAMAAARVMLDERVVEYLQNAYDMTAKEMEVAEKYVQQIEGGVPAQIEYLAGVRTRAKKAKVMNVKGYLVQALRNRF